MVEKMKGMLRMLGMVQTVVETAIVMGASGLAFLAFADGFYGFAAVCVAVAVLEQVAICQRTAPRMQEIPKGKYCVNCHWLRKCNDVYFLCGMGGNRVHNKFIYSPLADGCMYWRKKLGWRSGATKGEVRSDRILITRHKKKTVWFGFVANLVGPFETKPADSAMKEAGLDGHGLSVLSVR